MYYTCFRMSNNLLDSEITNILEQGLPVHRVKQSKFHKCVTLVVDKDQNLIYKNSKNGPLKNIICAPKNNGDVSIDDILDVRCGYNSDGFHRASKTFKFKQRAPESNCFSIVFKHPRFVCKSIDFVSTDNNKARLWVEALKHIVSRSANESLLFNEKLWIIDNFRKADTDKSGGICFSELWKLLNKLNLQLSEEYVHSIFKELTSKKDKSVIDESEFFKLFEILTDLPEYRNALRLFSKNGKDFLDESEVLDFLSNEQCFTNLDSKKVADMIAFCETDNSQTKILSANGVFRFILGFRRLLQSRWGNILKENHENIFQDMDQPLSHYFINSSHNTYLTGLQVRGNATVEGYISALRKGARLLEHVFDGDDGEPSITHKRTFISAISLRDALKCIAEHAFQVNPYPVILTIENHVGLVQQRVMSNIFIEILGDKLYMPSEDKLKALPSPNSLKNKILLRGKAHTTSTNTKEDDELATSNDGSKRSFTDPAFAKLIALPAIKFSSNMYSDIQDHPINGSISLSESKVSTYYEADAPIVAYTEKRLIKSYPSGIRQDSSNMSPIPSWLCGIQAVAMNMQTPSEELDIVKGFFNINGNIGYVLKPNLFFNGKDPKRELSDPKITLHLALICGQYLPKPGPGHDIIDPFVSIEIFGAEPDECKARTQAVHNNGFNPIWNENFAFTLYCPELAIIRFSVKDFDFTSSNDFIGEFSVPVTSIREGYSQIRLNTGFEHSPDDAASLLLRVKFDKLK